MAIELETYRRGVDRFIAELDEEYYLHFAGHKPELELAPIYERHEQLASLETCRELGERAASDPSVRELWRFACEGYLGSVTTEESEAIAGIEADGEVVLSGEPIPFRAVRAEIAGEADRERRARLDAARASFTEATLNPLYQAALERAHETARQLGSSGYRALYESFGFELAALERACAELLNETEELYVDRFGELCERRLGVSLDAAERHDIHRLLRAPNWDEGFPASTMLPALEQTLAGLGIDAHAQPNIHLDTDERPSKSPRAFCAPIEVPGRIMLVIKPMGGLDDWRALFHEAGHAQHFAHTSPALPVEARRLGDNAVTEGYAFLLERMVDDQVWLRRRLDFGRPDELASEAATVLLYAVRRYCGKLLYELGLHEADSLDGMPSRYAQALGEATRVAHSEADFLADVDPGFYCSSYLRAWAVEAHLREFFAERYGTGWFASPAAGSLLRELWYEGQNMDADRLVSEVTGSPLALSRIAPRLAEPTLGR